MTIKRRYNIAQGAQQLSSLMGVDIDAVLRRAMLPRDVLDETGRGVTADQYFACMEAAFALSDQPDLPVTLGQTLARAPFVPAAHAFSCSADVESGLQRLALFKPLVAPCAMQIDLTDDALTLTIGSTDPAARMPGAMSAFELVYFLEIARAGTGHRIAPITAVLTAPNDHVADYLGFAPVIGPKVQLVLSRDDARRPLISANAEFLAELEKKLSRELADIQAQHGVAERVRQALIGLLPSGQANADAVCDRLRMSRRSLQRRLSAEGVSFRSILDELRTELSMHYLRRDDMNVEEISYLLAYRDPNSFYRAFHGWTGMTPLEARQSFQAVGR